MHEQDSVCSNHNHLTLKSNSKYDVCSVDLYKQNTQFKQNLPSSSTGEDCANREILAHLRLIMSKSSRASTVAAPVS